MFACNRLCLFVIARLPIGALFLCSVIRNRNHITLYLFFAGRWQVQWSVWRRRVCCEVRRWRCSWELLLKKLSVNCQPVVISTRSLECRTLSRQPATDAFNRRNRSTCGRASETLRNLVCTATLCSICMFLINRRPNGWASLWTKPGNGLILTEGVFSSSQLESRSERLRRENGQRQRRQSQG